MPDSFIPTCNQMLYIGQSRPIRVPYFPDSVMRLDVPVHRKCLDPQQPTYIEGHVYRRCSRCPVEGVDVTFNYNGVSTTVETDRCGYYRINQDLINKRVCIKVTTECGICLMHTEVCIRDYQVNIYV